MTKLRSLAIGDSFMLPNAVAIGIKFRVVAHVKGRWTFSDLTETVFESDGREQSQTFSSDLEVIPVST